MADTYKSFLVNRFDKYASVLETKGQLELARKLDVMSSYLDGNPKLAKIVDNLIKLGYNEQQGKVKPQVESDEGYMKNFGETKALQYDADEKSYMNSDPLHSISGDNNRQVIDRKEDDVRDKSKLTKSSNKATSQKPVKK